MRIQFAAALKDHASVDFKDEGGRSLTLGTVCCLVLDVPFQDDMNEGFKPKLRRAELIEKIMDAEKALTPLDMIDSDRDMLKERVGKRNFSASLTLAAVRLLDADVGDGEKLGKDE